MALTRKSLKAMGLTEEQVDSIIEMHTETVDGLKADIDRYKADAEQLPVVRRELDDLKAADDGGWEEKYNTEHAAHEKLKADIAAEKTASAKEKAVRAYFEGKGITGDNLTIAMLGSGKAAAELELDGETIKDTAALDALVNGAFAKLVTTTIVKGATTPNPPANDGGKATFDAMPLSEKMRYANEHPAEAAEWLK